MQQSIIALATVLGLANSAAAQLGLFHGTLIDPQGSSGDGTQSQLTDLDRGIVYEAANFPGYGSCISPCLMTFVQVNINEDGTRPSFPAFLSKDLQGCVHLDLDGSFSGQKFTCCDGPDAPVLQNGQSGAANCLLH